MLPNARAIPRKRLNRQSGSQALPILIVLATHIFAAPMFLSGQTPAWQTGGNNVLYVPSGTNIGIGTSSPTRPLEVATDGSQGNEVIIGRMANDSTSARPVIKTRKSRGSLTSPTMLQAGDPIGGINFESLAVPQLWAGGGGMFSNVEAVDANFAYGNLTFYTFGNLAGWSEKLRITGNGNVGIGTTAPQHKLSVNGTIGTKEVVVTNTGWADYVLKPGYRLTPLGEVAAYIKENQRLPEIQSAKEVEEKGVSLGDMQVKLLAKIEELTLHVIQLDERNRQLEQEIRDLKATRER